MSKKSDREAAAKARLLERARRIARAGFCPGWSAVLRHLKQEGGDVSTLQLWATAADRAQIDRLCEAARKS